MKTHDLPCWCGEGRSCCSIYLSPKPHINCFKCDKQNWQEDVVEEYMSNLVPNMFSVVKTISPIKRGIVNSLPGRGLSKETCEKYGIETLFNDAGEPYATSFQGRNDEGVVAQKVKTPDKKMYWNGEFDKVTYLYGQHLFPAGGKYVTITEGEEDAAATYQMLKAHTGYDSAVVSIPNGVASAEKFCKQNWEYLNSFENIIVCFDGDDTGKKAAEKVVKLFDYKAKIVSFGDYVNKDGKNLWKDASDYLIGNKERDFVKLWYNAEKLVPKGVCSVKSLWNDMIRTDTNIVVPFPFEGLNKFLGGWSTGHLGFIIAGVKVGKTTLLKELAYSNLINTPFNTGLILLEETKKSIGLGLCALHLSRPVNLPNAEYTIEELAKAHEALSAEDRLMVFDPQDERTVENIFNKIKYFVKVHNVKYLILDHVTMMAYQAEDDNERKFLDKLIADLKELTTSLDIGIIAVSHVNDEGKTRGSRAAGQLCDWMISLERDKLSEDPIIKNTINVTVLDNRWGESGKACSLFYDRDTGRLTELDKDIPVMDGKSAYRDVKFDT